MFLPSVVLHLPVLLHENALQKFEEMCSEEVHPNMEQRLLYLTVYIRMSTLKSFLLFLYILTLRGVNGSETSVAVSKKLIQWSISSLPKLTDERK